jgi:hypothetical protein
MKSTRNLKVKNSLIIIAFLIVALKVRLLVALSKLNLLIQVALKVVVITNLTLKKASLVKGRTKRVLKTVKSL